MDITWKYIDLNVSLFEINQNSNIYIDEYSSVLLITNPKTTSIIQFDPLTFNTKTSEIFSNNSGNHILFSNSGIFYYLSGNGTLQRLLCTSNMSIDHGSVFGSSGSSASEVFSWSKICDNLGEIVNATGVTNGFAAITKNSEMFSFYLYENLDKPTIQCSKRLQGTEQKQWKMFSFKTNNVSQPFLKHLFGELSLVLTDIIVLSTPTGTVMLFPVIADKSFQDFVPIHCDTDNLIYVDISPCKNAFLLFYQNGRLVIIFYNERVIEYKKIYLSTTIKTLSIINQGLNFSILWSDGSNTYYTIPSQLKDFSVSERKTNIRGIVKIEKVNNKMLLFNVNCCAYLAELTTSLNYEKYSEPNLKTAIIKLSKNIEILQKSVQETDKNLETLKIEQTNSTQFKLSLENHTLCIENLSSAVFKHKKWSVFLELKDNFRILTKTFNLQNDLCPSEKLEHNIKTLMFAGCTKLKVFFKAQLCENQRLLVLSIGSLDVMSTGRRK